MRPPATTDPGGEAATALALELLDELRLLLLECLLVVESLPVEVDMNFDELLAAIRALQPPAKQAFGAASLLHSGAELNQPWGNNLSRPKAIFARHSAAVRGGAERIEPAESSSDEFERWLSQLPALDGPEGFTGDRPRCQAFSLSSSQPCTSVAIYLGSGAFGPHCYPHSNSEDRMDYRLYQERANAELQQARVRKRELVCAVGLEVAAHWLQRRQTPREWLDLTESLRADGIVSG